MWGFSDGSVVKNLPAGQETWVWSLGWEDPLEDGMTTHFSTLAQRIPWTEEPGGLQSIGSHRVRHDWATKLQQHSTGNPPQCSGVTSVFWGDLNGKDMHPFLFGFPSHFSHHRTLNRLPCATQLVLISYLFMHNRVYVSIPTSQFTPPFPRIGTGIYAFVLYICVSISALKVSSSAPLF